MSEPKQWMKDAAEDWYGKPSEDEGDIELKNRRDGLVRAIARHAPAPDAELRAALEDIRDGSQLRTGYTYAALARAALARLSTKG
jgi:hypothetical protein